MSQPTDMTYVRLGKSGLKVSRIILGCMSYGREGHMGWILGEEESMKQIKAAYDMGINAFDTANVYSNGLSEVVLGKAIKKYNLPRDEIVVLTKVFFPLGHEAETHAPLLSLKELEAKRYANQHGLSRKHIFESVKHSLERLQLDYIDVLQCHRFDPNTPIEETMHALHDVVQAGYVRYIGMSSCYAWQFAKMQYYAEAHNLTKFISMQNFYNAIYREEEREMVSLLQDMGVGMIPWSPLGGGFLTRKIEQKDQSTRGKNDVYQALAGDPEKDQFLEEINEGVAAIAEKRGVSMAQVALAYVLAKPFVTAPIIGTTSLEKLNDLLAGLKVKLTEDEVKAIDAPYKPRAIQGHA